MVKRPNNKLKYVHTFQVCINRYSIVSMTTVGYGDKVPITIAGKIVAMVWIFLGFSKTSLFTATLTTILSIFIVGNEMKNHIGNARVGVIAATIERHLVLQEGGTPIGIFSF